ncbi:MAG: heme-binding protein [Weeksellaceae bacterium]|uniref:GlcG/HbpS family heme-binding protein n=1 Tax=Kaistella soli TaxID=2849654 RepID=UPI001C2791AC|nr:heme-binding protein [Kaistella soli]MBU4538141.1 heme-binding protein [Bacteroidota bacterium]MBU8881533.1 heme-binding protein [Kaistella soli]MCG2781467.1 heme-binding protein [Weeksellaceae bacterium]
MKIFALGIVFISALGFAQNRVDPKMPPHTQFVKSVDNLTLDAAMELATRSIKKADALEKKVTVAVLDASGEIILLMRGDGVGPHNTEAARRKAYTALSTKTPTLLLMRNAAANPDTQNLNTLPELLLLSGGTPVWYKGNVIGSIGIAGGGSAENDDLIAKAASVPDLGIHTVK